MKREPVSEHLDILQSNVRTRAERFMWYQVLARLRHFLASPGTQSAEPLKEAAMPQSPAGSSSERQWPGPKGLELIKQFEGCRLQAYLDSAGVPTIGYGSTGKDVVLGVTWTSEQAEKRLIEHARAVAKAVGAAVKVPLSQGQLDALTSLVYNIGISAFKSSTLLKLLNAGDYQAAADQFLRWNKITVNGEKRTLGGLVTRRAIERDLFLAHTTGVTT